MTKRKYKGKEYDIREFLFDAHRWEDPGVDFTNEEVRVAFAKYFGDLNNASVSKQQVKEYTRIIDDEEKKIRVLEITFKKKVGTKG